MNKLWRYLGNQDGSFLAPNADQTSRLYFPLMNESGMRCSVTPELKGDISAGFDQYLMPPVVTEELHRTHNARYFWLNIAGEKPWNINGLSPDQQVRKWTDGAEAVEITARPGSFVLHRHHADLPLKAEICLTVPATNDQVELWKVKLLNLGDKPISFTPFVALPLFGRHADNLRDHRQVTTMFQKCFRDNEGVRIKPTIVHDEKGHRKNDTTYFIYGYEADGALPDRIWTRMQDFIGEGGSMSNPRVVWDNTDEPELKPEQRHGVEAIGAMSFPGRILEQGQQIEYVVVVGVTKRNQTFSIADRYNSADKFNQFLNQTHQYWHNLTSQVRFQTGHPAFNEWTHWLAFQLKCRQIYGNSFLPDFGYGRGGRGWRDLWQDLLSIFLVDPDSAKNEIVNNLKGIRIDGSNATIIGSEPGQFKADRNNIARTWSDHGAWPLVALNFYIQQSGDLEVLETKIPYWKDQFVHRSKKIDREWNEQEGNWLKDQSGTIYEASVFEHALVQQLSAFYHVGEHNILLLEGADWNDTLDMAGKRGESVCFQSFYAGNFGVLVRLLTAMKQQGIHEIELLSELAVLLDRCGNQAPVNYDDPKQKQDRLAKYFLSVGGRVSGQKELFLIDELLADLKAKEYHARKMVREQEWITKDAGGYFNGHYNDRGEAMHGSFPEGWRMDLTSQVMPIMFDVADNEQIEMAYQSARELLGEPFSPGLRLCTPYPELDLNIGRITGFVYGYKEHGSKWMQQNIMLMYGLYKRNHVEAGTEMLRQIIEISQENPNALHFPGVPSYYEPGNRGAYMYLTGSSTWLYLTLVTQVFGLRGDLGDLIIDPKIPLWLFAQGGKAETEIKFQGQNVRVIYNNPDSKQIGQYAIQSIRLNDKELPITGDKIARIEQNVLRSSERDPAIIEVNLG